MEHPDTDSAGSAGFRHLRVSAEGGLRRIDLDRPPLNVLDIAMMRELDAALEAVALDPDASVLLISGRGKAFCAGVDVADHVPERVEEMILVFHGFLERLAALELPTVAALNGAALGGGMELALACDIVLARGGARLGQPEIRLGVFPPFAAAVLPRLVGRAHALELCLSGRTLEAEEGARLGLVQHVYPQETFAEDATRYAADLAGLSRPVLRLAKRAVVRSVGAPLDDALRAVERLYLDELMGLSDAREGLNAFMEKRPPVWTGA
jgi:cyclohexa-1,5-dienecarbonyl-CoA hydratase